MRTELDKEKVKLDENQVQQTKIFVILKCVKQA